METFITFDAVFSNHLNRIDNEMKYVIVIKCSKEAFVVSDLTKVGEILGVHRDTARGRLPYWEDSDVIFSAGQLVKSKRGRQK